MAEKEPLYKTITEYLAAIEEGKHDGAALILDNDSCYASDPETGEELYSGGEQLQHATEVLDFFGVEWEMC